MDVGDLVGRAPALAMAGAVVDDALRGSGRLLLIAGDPGIGKTALARTIAWGAAVRGARPAWAACWPGGGAPAYWPWTQLLREAAGLQPTSALGAAARLVPELAGPASPRSVRTDADRFELYDAVAGALARLCDAGPVVAVLDDLHWADDASVDLLDFVARHSRGRRLLLLGTYRDLEAGDTLRRLAASADGISLGGVGADAVAAMMTAITGTRPDADLIGDMCRRTAGNPLFVRELTRLLVVRGAGVTRPRDAMGALPDSVLETLQRRLERVSANCRRLLTLVALLNRPTLELLTTLAPSAGLRADRTTGLIGEAVAARVAVVDADSSTCELGHGLFREVLLSVVDATERARLSGAAADTLSRWHDAGLPVSAAQIAGLRRAASGGADVEAIRWSMRAGDEATTRLAHADACRHYRDAMAGLTARGDSGDAQISRLHVLLRLAVAEHRVGASTARATFLDAVAAARAVDDASALAEAALGIHALGARSPGAHNANIALLDEAAAASTQHPALRARLLAALARELVHSLAPAGAAVEPATEAVELARELGDAEVLVACLLALHDAHWAPGTARVRLRICDQMLAAARSAGDAEGAAQAGQVHAACLLELNDRGGRGALDEFCYAAEGLGHATGRWEALTRRATAALIDGRLDDAARLADQGRALGEEMGLPDAIGVHGTLRWQLCHLRGTRVEMLDEIRRLGDVPAQAAFEASAYAEAGDAAAARAAAARIALDDLQDKYDLEFTSLVAEGLAAGGSPADCRVIYERLQPHAGTNVVVGGCASFWGPVDLYLGMLAAALGDSVSAAGHFEAAVKMAEGLGAPAWSALVCEERDRRSATGAVNEMRRDGDVWYVRFGGATAHLADVKGLQDIAILVSRAGEDVSAMELHTGDAHVDGGADAVLDAQAKGAYRERLVELDGAIDDADAANDPFRAQCARDEREALIAELRGAVGLGGRDRRLGDRRERARKAVSARIRDAISRMDPVQPELAAHLRDSIRTGTWCSYRPIGGSQATSSTTTPITATIVTPGGNASR